MCMGFSPWGRWDANKKHWKMLHHTLPMRLLWLKNMSCDAVEACKEADRLTKIAKGYMVSLKLAKELSEQRSRDGMVVMAHKALFASTRGAVKMAHMLALPLELLNTIITLVAMSSDGAKDWARVSATCKAIKTAARQTNVLQVIDCRNVKAVGLSKPPHQINSLLSRCVRAGNLSAEYMLAKAVLRGGAPLWKTIMENNLMNSSIKCATALPLSERRYIAESLNTGSIADLAYILFSLEDVPYLHESYERLNPLRLVRSFVLEADSKEFFPIRHVVKDFMEFFVGYHNYSESDIHDHISRMCDSILSADGQLADQLLEAFWHLSGTPSFKHRVTSALDTALQQEPLPY